MCRKHRLCICNILSGTYTGIKERERENLLTEANFLVFLETQNLTANLTEENNGGSVGISPSSIGFNVYYT